MVWIGRFILITWFHIMHICKVEDDVRWSIRAALVHLSWIVLVPFPALQGPISNVEKQNTKKTGTVLSGSTNRVPKAIFHVGFPWSSPVWVYDTWKVLPRDTYFMSNQTTLYNIRRQGWFECLQSTQYSINHEDRYYAYKPDTNKVRKITS